MTALVRRREGRAQHGVVLLGVPLQDKREELFAIMVCDGVSIALAFERAGFTKPANSAPTKIWELPRVQARAAAILEARAKTGVVTLPEVTDMLKRVFAKAYHNDEMNAAHNAAFSLARLYGHVTDRASIEVLRKPSRDPDAPSELALGAWIEALPGPGPGPEPEPPSPLLEPASQDARGPIGNPEPGLTIDLTAVPQGPSPAEFPSEINHLPPSLEGSGPIARDPIACDTKKPNDIKGLEGSGARPSENGAPSGPVTGTPHSGARSKTLSEERIVHPPVKEKRVPPSKAKVPAPSGAAKRKKKRMKELFG